MLMLTTSIHLCAKGHKIEPQHSSSIYLSIIYSTNEENVKYKKEHVCMCVYLNHTVQILRKSSLVGNLSRKTENRKHFSK